MNDEVRYYTEDDQARFLKGPRSGLLIAIPHVAGIICGLSFLF